MKDYKDLFYFKREKDNLAEVMSSIGSIKGKLAFYDCELSNGLDVTFSKVYKLYKELEEKLEDEKKKFTKEELKELHFIYKEKYNL